MKKLIKIMNSSIIRCCGWLLILTVFNSVSALQTAHLLESPNKEHKVEIFIRQINQIEFKIYYKNKSILTVSEPDFLFENGKKLSKQSRTVNLPKPVPYEVRNSWTPVFGERNTIPENYNETVLELQGLLKIILRAYNEGIAFCYEFETRENETLKIAEELTKFSFSDDYPCWTTYSAQGVYQKVPVSKMKKDCERPLLFQIPDGPAFALGEARLVDFARMRFQPVSGEKNTIAAQLAGNVEISGTGKPFRSPWRFIMIADSPGRLLEQNYMVLNLNDPCSLADTSWIKPGKIIREGTLTTKGGKTCVDFAAERGLQYVEFDAGWYGQEHDDASDARVVNLDPKRSKGPLDLQEVIKYADSKNIGIIVYVNQRALTRQFNEILPLYKNWGIKGIKFGFVNVGSQQATRWLFNAVKKCAEYKLMVDIHDEYRDTGWSRTLPNLMTVEGVRGNEEMPPPELNVVLPMTRSLCGFADYTPCWYHHRIKTSQAHQLALPIVVYSPWTFLFWYDNPDMFQGEPELDLWKELPTVWDETKVLIDNIPNTVAIARRNGTHWYVGILNAGEKRTILLPIDSLFKTGKSYKIIRYTDEDLDGNGKKILSVEINNETVPIPNCAEIPLRSNGGAVLKISEHIHDN
ncbi:MAG: glycoside hydrolase family 97 protein [Planctomycetaceae bacterium]|nr:glycoside hydrolase family 97 protein [Planctomycetaceae bacterium]